MGARIDHAAEAVKHIEWAHEQQEQEGDMGSVPRDNALLAQAHATLALVEQNRIANLIDLGRLEGAAGLDPRGPLLEDDPTATDDVWAPKRFRQDIQEGLGL